MSIIFQIYERIKNLFFGNKYQKINDKDDELSVDIIKNDCKYIIDALNSFINDAFIVHEKTKIDFADNEMIINCLSAYIYYMKDVNYKKEFFRESSRNLSEKEKIIYKYVSIPYHPKVYKNGSIYYNICISSLMLKLTDLFNNMSIEERRKSIPIETLQYLDT